MVFVITDPPDRGDDSGTGTTSPTLASGVTIKLPAGAKSIVGIAVRDGANALRTVVEGWIRTPAGLKQFFAGLRVAVSALTVGGARNNASTVLVTTTTVTATGVGGSPPYVPVWTRTDGGAHPWTISSPSTRSTAFRTNVAPHSSEVATFVCTMTDAVGTPVPSDTVTATASNG